MKEKFSKILAWAKAHPWIAGLIVVGVIGLGYLAYKRSAASSGSANDQTAAPVDSSGVTQPDYSGIGSGGGGGGPTGTTGAGSSVGTIPAFQDNSSNLSPFSYSAPDMTPAFAAVGLTSSDNKTSAIPAGGGGRTIAGALESLQPYQTVVPGALAKSAASGPVPTISAPVRTSSPAQVQPAPKVTVATSGKTAGVASTAVIKKQTAPKASTPAKTPVKITTSGRTAGIASTAVIKKQTTPIYTPYVAPLTSFYQSVMHSQ